MENLTATLWNITQLADELGVHRNTVRKRLKASGVLPVDKKGNTPLYLMADAAKAVFAPEASGTGEYCGYDSPDQMSATERKHWFESERSRVQLEEDARQLIPAEDVARGYAEFIKAIINPLDSLADKLEQKCGLHAEAVEQVQAVVDAVREQMYLRAIKSGAELDGDDD